MKIGELVGSGRTSRVFEWGAGAVVKVPRADVPLDWPLLEAELTRAVKASGVPVPEVIDVVEIEGRNAIVFQRIYGPSMWQAMLADPAGASGLAADLASVHRALLSVGIPERLPDLVDRMTKKIEAASDLPPAEQATAIDLTQQLPRGAALLHGDLHPGNVLMGEHGPVVIDWFDAAIGHPIADVVRSSILIRPMGPNESHSHLPDGLPGLLGEVHGAYLQAFAPELELAVSELPNWQAVVAASRLAEGAQINNASLLRLWGLRDDRSQAQAFVAS